MDIRLRSLFAAAGCAALIACSGSSPQTKKTEVSDCDGPAWTCMKSGPCVIPEFKDSLCAVGMADSISSYNLGMQTASTRARTEMGAVLKSQVDGFTRVVQDSLSKAGVGEESIQKVGDLSQNVVETTLAGVTIPRTWFNKETKVYYAVAVVDAKTFVNALKGLRDAKGLSDQVKAEIEQRAQSVANDWEKERDRKQAAR